MRCEEPVKIIEILRLWEQGYSQRQIAASVKCAKSTVGEVQKRCREKELSYEEARLMTNDAIQEKLYPASFAHKQHKDDPDWPKIYVRLHAHKRLNLQYIWEEYRQQEPTGLSYSQFCRRYHVWLERTGKNVIMLQQRQAGRELFVDWMGDTLAAVIDSETGKLHQAHFFVAVLGDSSYPYVEAFPDEKLDKWLLAHVHTLEWIGGVPRIIVPDNCKTAVSKPNYYDPQVNPAYWELAKYYEVAVIPARIRSPHDKSSVESGIGWLETWLLEWLRGQRFFSFAELNRAIKERLAELIRRPFQKRPGSRGSVFTELDQPALRALPRSSFEHAEYVLRRTPDSYHVEYNKVYYSVPYTLHKQQVTLRVTSRMVEIFNENRERVALHERRYAGSPYVTNPSHMPEHHRYQTAQNHFDGARYRQWAATIGEHTFYVIDTLLKSQHVEETAYRSCMGLLQMSKSHGYERLEAACARARELGSSTYTTVRNILKNSQDKAPYPEAARALPAHTNLRHPGTFH